MEKSLEGGLNSASFCSTKKWRCTAGFLIDRDAAPTFQHSIYLGIPGFRPRGQAIIFRTPMAMVERAAN